MRSDHERNMRNRTTIVLPGPLKQRAVARAREQGISFGEFVRRAVEKMLAAPPRGTGRKKTGDPFWDNLEFYEGGPADLSTRHDKRLYRGDNRLVQRAAPQNEGAIDWLLACPEKDFFVPIDSESTDAL